MAADPADRFASAAAFQKALETMLRGPIVRVTIAGVAGLVLLGVLGYQFATRWTVTPAKSNIETPGRSAVPIPTAVQPIKGRIDLLVVKSKDGTRRRLRLEDRGAVPVRADDEIRIEAGLDRPAYLYLFWLGSEGKVAPSIPGKSTTGQADRPRSGK